jgi:hypothetical protein
MLSLLKPNANNIVRMNFTLTTNELTPQRAPMSQKNDSIDEEIIKTVLNKTIDLVAEEAEPKSQDVPEESQESSQSMDTLATTSTFVSTSDALKRAKSIVDNVEVDEVSFSDFTSDEDSADITADILTELGSPPSKKYVIDGEEITIGKKRDRNDSEITQPDHNSFGSPRPPPLNLTPPLERGYNNSPAVDYTLTDGEYDLTPILPCKKRKVGRFLLFETDIRMASDQSVKYALEQLQHEMKRRADNRV